MREFQSYVVNPHLAGHTVGLSPLVTLIAVSVVGLLFGAFAVVLAIPAAAAAATLASTSSCSIATYRLHSQPGAAVACPVSVSYAVAACWTSRTRNARTMSLTPRMIAQAATQATSSTALRP